VIEFDTICPVCGLDADVQDEVSAGEEVDCKNCGMPLMVEEWDDGTMSLVLPSDDEAEIEIKVADEPNPPHP